MFRGQALVILAHAFIGVAAGTIKDAVTFNPSGESPGSLFIYDKAPKLKLKGSGFQAMFGEESELDLVFDPPMEKGHVYANVAVKADDTLTLELLQDSRWIGEAGASTVPRELYVKEATFKGEALLDSPVLVGKVVPTPTVTPATTLLYLSATPRLKIEGTNFNFKQTNLFFSPPLRVGEDVDVKVLSSEAVTVTLVQKNNGQKWAEEPGPLKLVAIDTGAGKVVLREDLGGITIAEIQADLEGHGISVNTHEEVRIYQSSKVLTISGSGFRTENNGGTQFRFGNPLILGKNYTVEVQESSAVFSLVEGSKWRKNSTGLPSPLVLLAAEAGAGWVALGATTAKKGRKIATVYEDPSLESRGKEISRTETHNLIIKGKGFANSFAPKFTFDPNIETEDYVVHVLNRTHVAITLASAGKGWMEEGKTGDLKVRAVNTGAGIYPFPEPVLVARVVEDGQPHHSGINFKPSYDVQLYQSSSGPLIIEGENFPMDEEPEITFGAAGPEPGSVSCKVLSESTLVVTLVDGYTWSVQGGPLFLSKIKFGDHEVVKKNPGLKVATINEDPLVEASQLRVYASHTKHITIQGHGFMSSHDPFLKPEVVLSPTLPEDYVIDDNGWTGAAITISLNSKSKISSVWAEVTEDAAETVAVKVLSINTGAGVVEMPGGGIVVAAVRADDATFSCDDSCIYSNDGQCDEDQGGESIEALQWSGYPISNGAVTSSFTSQAGSNRGSYAGATDSSLFGASDDFIVHPAPSCQLGTDCTDCGLQITEEGKCVNTCQFARDGSCDDKRASGLCADGTDCQDCGPWEHGNFTDETISLYPASESYNDDDSGFLVKDPDHPMLKGQSGNAIGRYRRPFLVKLGQVHRKEMHEGAAGVFMETLWAAIVIVGFSVVVYLGLLVTRCAKGQHIELPIPTNPDVEARR